MTQPDPPRTASLSLTTGCSDVNSSLFQKNNISIPCVKCKKAFKIEDLVKHLKSHRKEDVSSETMGRNSVDVKESKLLEVKLSTMPIAIKRKRHGSHGDSCKRVRLQDGETELLVDPTVDKVKCKYCKPDKFFKDVDILRYHLVSTHKLSKSSSYMVNPCSSPGKPTESSSDTENNVKRVRVKSTNELSEIKDFNDSMEEDAVASGSEDPSSSSETVRNDDCLKESPSVLVGEVKEILKLRRTKLKRPPVVNGRSTKIQPPCSSDKAEVMEEVKSENSDIKIEVKDKAEVKEEAKSDNSDIEIKETELNQSKDVDKTGESVKEEKEESKVFAIPFPVTEKQRSGKMKTTSKQPVKRVEVAPRRMSERRFAGVKPYKCNHCELSYSSLENKKVHETTHTDKTHVCPYCEMRFFYPLCLKRHVRIHKN